MKFSSNTFTAFLLLLSNAQHSLGHPQLVTDVQLVQERVPRVEEVFADGNALVKRKGGGGGGGKGGGGGSSGKGGGSSGSGSRGGSGSGGSSRGGSSGGGSSSSVGKGSSSSISNSKGSSSAPKGSSGSNSGGATKQGSGVRPTYGGGRYYGGGATTPYAAGVASPLGILPVLILSSALLFWTAAWIYGAYEYPYHHPYTFHNTTAVSNTTNTTIAGGQNQTKSVLCFCAVYAECGCDDNGNTTFLDSIIGDGNYASLNKTLVDVADVNGTSTILLNGTLPNGTTTSGGTENANAAIRSVGEITGYWATVALVVGMVWFL